MALVLFYAIPACWVSKHNSVGLIRLQLRSSEPVAAQRRWIPKCVVKTSAVTITASVLRSCKCAASVCPKMSFFLATWWKASLADFHSSFCFAHFLLSDLCSHWPTKNKLCLWLVGSKLLWFFNADRRWTQKINTNIWPLRNITNPTGWDGVKMCYRRCTRLCTSCDGVHWGEVKHTVFPYGSIYTNFDPSPFSLDSAFKW